MDIPNGYSRKVGTSPPITVTLECAPTLLGNTVVVIRGVETRRSSPSKDVQCLWSPIESPLSFTFLINLYAIVSSRPFVKLVCSQFYIHDMKLNNFNLHIWTHTLHNSMQSICMVDDMVTWSCNKRLSVIT